MAALTPTSLKVYNSGSQTKYVAKFSAVAINGADTYTPGIGGAIQDFNYVVTADPTTDASAGANVVEASGVFTFFPGVDALSGTLTFYSDGA
jgi:hypothetical protein